MRPDASFEQSPAVIRYSSMPPTAYKIPISVLVVIHTPAKEVLLIERADDDGAPTGYWQSVTGSLDREDEPPHAACAREVMEETGIDVRAGVLSDWYLQNIYDIYAQWQHRYAPGVMRNTEHVFGLCLPARVTPVLSPREHVAWRWLPHLEAADACSSMSNTEAILMLPRLMADAQGKR
jgi:dihydroneopterin triphosphate diphosphatase